MKEIIELKNISKQYHNISVLDDLNLKIPLGEALSILGPSGSGKTTLLKIIAKIITADTGSINLFGRNKSKPVLVFQNYQLFPYMSVYNNIAFGLHARKIPKKEIKKKVEAMATKLSINLRLKAYPSQLSGGEKQRCALARALVLNPEIILLDEPFANLDRNLKSETAELLRMIQQNFNLTMITVTHDQEEALMVADKLAILLSGKVLEFGRAEDIYYNPRTLTGAKFLGPINEISKEIHEYFRIETPNVVYCRAESLEMIPVESGRAKIKSKQFKGRYFGYFVELSNTIIQLFSQQKNLCVGDMVDLKIKEYFSIQE